ncbi:MAG TPA: DUF4352 domain-containing protein [Nitrolancea sp.]|nr:DUF4352 domain-containing protein [Nitrolancea sp.]
MKRQYLIPIVLGLLIALAGVACGAAHAPVPSNVATPGADGDYAIGQPAHIGTYVVTVKRVMNQTDVNGVSPDNGKRFLVLDLEVQNLDTNNARLSPAAQFIILDEDGTQYPMDGDVTPTTELSSPSLPNTIPALGSIHGEIAFQVPANVPNGFRLTFNPSFLMSLFSHGKTITFDLG